ncbi:MAG: biopolymer transporter ExbD [Candidatus Omnitrophica bacterium]|nr:biopolymer transporter ExbD [Candidatus Omnitrophota bacterium]MDE2221997.1 biopolymer transporter ExbD [Candidatus Omnitrophota bacterium]
MSLEHSRVRTNIFHPVLGVAFINFVLTMAVLIMSATVFAKPAGVLMELPSSREDFPAEGIVIKITSENVIYIDRHVVTLTELKSFLVREGQALSVLTVKADSRASMGRVADVLNLCRGLSGVQVNVGTVL